MTRKRGHERIGKMQLHPRQLNDEQAERVGIPRGWWALTDDGQPVLGPYPSREATLIGITAHGTAGPRPETSGQSGCIARPEDDAAPGS